VESILIVEDDADLQEALSEALEGEGYRVRSARNGQEALEELALDEDQPNLILLDLVMPLMNGWKFLDERQRRANLSDIPVLVLSGFGGARPPHTAGVLRKPIHPLELFRAVRQAVAPGGHPV
jgi:CheY-like chemotaxis protein